MTTAFETEMGVMEEISRAIDEMGWILPTDIQGDAIPKILGGVDVLMAAETGTGKTGAFCLPVLQLVFETLSAKPKSRDKGRDSSASQLTIQMNPYDREDQLALSACGLRCQSRDPRGWHGARANMAVALNNDVTSANSSSLVYYEATVLDEGLCRVGWGGAGARLELGKCAQGFGFGGTGKASSANQFNSYGESFGLRDTIGCWLCVRTGAVGWTKNGRDFGAAPLPRVPPNLIAQGLFPAVTLKNSQLEFNFGATPFKFAPPKGAQSLHSLLSSQSNASNSAAKIFQSQLSSSNAAANQKQQAPQFDNQRDPLALIIEPTRELAEQTFRQLTLFKKYLPNPAAASTALTSSSSATSASSNQGGGSVGVLLITGGGGSSDPRAQEEALRRANGTQHIVVATPGRLDDLLQSGLLRLRNVRHFVLDECDALLQQQQGGGGGGMMGTISRWYSQMPKMAPDGSGMHLQMVICSATLHAREVVQLANSLMHYPEWCDLKGRDSVPDTVHHVICRVDPDADQSWTAHTNSNRMQLVDGVHQKDGRTIQDADLRASQAIKLLKLDYVIAAIRQLKMDRAIVFCRTKLDCDNLERFFCSQGGGPNAPPSHPLSCVCLHSDRRPAERKDNLERFKLEQVRLLICTDVAARGLDIKGLPYVINVTMPDDKQNYVHRIGRVGRAERMGLAISFVAAAKEKVWYHSNCANRGRGCYNTQLVAQGGCCIWMNETQLLAEVEEHLGVTIDEVRHPAYKLEVNSFDGKVVYGQKLKKAKPIAQGHVDLLKPTVQQLLELERKSQICYLKQFFGISGVPE